MPHVNLTVSFIYYAILLKIVSKMVKLEMIQLTCIKCGHFWIPAGTEVFICPECKCSLEKYPPKKTLIKPKGKKGAEN